MSLMPMYHDATHDLNDSSRDHLLRSFFFFFQAEDGIRDLTVTGVQTCALPIYVFPAACAAAGAHAAVARATRTVATLRGTPRGRGAAMPSSRRRSDLPAGSREIGRASCRERV